MLHNCNCVWFLTVCYLTSILLAVGGCVQDNNHCVDKSSGEKGVVFRLIPSTGRHSASGTEVVFQFRNDSPRVVQVSGFFGRSPKDGVLKVGYTEYEIQVAGKWKRLDVGYDGEPEYYPVQPGNELRLLITLGPFEKQNVPGTAPVRVILEKFISEVFTLDSAIGAKK